MQGIKKIIKIIKTIVESERSIKHNFAKLSHARRKQLLGKYRDKKRMLMDKKLTEFINFITFSITQFYSFFSLAQRLESNDSFLFSPLFH